MEGVLISLNKKRETCKVIKCKKECWGWQSYGGYPCL